MQGLKKKLDSCYDLESIILTPYHLSLLPTSVSEQCPCRAHETLALRELPVAVGQTFQSEKR